MEKEAKLAAKASKVTANTATGEKKAKAEREKKEEEPPYVNTTPKGQKKGAPNFLFCDVLILNSIGLSLFLCRHHPAYVRRV